MFCRAASSVSYPYKKRPIAPVTPRHTAATVRLPAAFLRLLTYPFEKPTVHSAPLPTLKFPALVPIVDSAGNIVPLPGKVMIGPVPPVIHGVVVPPFPLEPPGDVVPLPWSPDHWSQCEYGSDAPHISQAMVTTIAPAGDQAGQLNRLLFLIKHKVYGGDSDNRAYCCDRVDQKCRKRLKIFDRRGYSD